MSKVYAVGVLQADLSENARRFIIDQRLWYIFGDFASAEECVLKNQSDIFEWHYNLALIEEISIISPLKDQIEGWMVPKQWWYKITYHEHPNDNIDIPPTIEQIETPKCVENMACFWVG